MDAWYDRNNIILTESSRDADHFSGSFDELKPTGDANSVQEHGSFSERYLKPVPVRFDPDNNSKEYNENVAANINRIVMEHNGAISIENIRLELLGKHGIQIEQNENLQQFLEAYKSNFVIQEVDDSSTEPLVACKTSMALCSAFCVMRKCNEKCNALHICKQHILNQCQDKRECLYGHYVYTPHNKRVLKSHLLQYLTFYMIRDVLKAPWNRRGLLVPKICSFYNVERGCGKDSNCTFLHLCKYTGNCKFWPNCKRSHDVKDNHNTTILRAYGIPIDTDENLLLQQICVLTDTHPSLSSRKMKWIKSPERDMENKPVQTPSKVEGDFDKTEQIPSAHEEQEPNNLTKSAWAYGTLSTQQIVSMTTEEANELEEHYQRFLRAKEYSISVNGTRLVSW